jgi:hypothetical protein
MMSESVMNRESIEGRREKELLLLLLLLQLMMIPSPTTGRVMHKRVWP